MNELNIGDLVVLKSGSTAMTVCSSVEGMSPSQVCVCWFYDGGIQKAVLDKAVLNIANKAEKAESE